MYLKIKTPAKGFSFGDMSSDKLIATFIFDYVIL